MSHIGNGKFHVKKKNIYEIVSVLTFELKNDKNGAYYGHSCKIKMSMETRYTFIISFVMSRVFSSEVCDTDIVFLAFVLARAHAYNAHTFDKHHRDDE